MLYQKIIILLIIASFLAFLVINIDSPIRIEGDGVFYYSWLHSATFDADFDFRNELEYFSSYDVGSRWMLETDFKTYIGKISSPYAYGTGLMWLPGVLVAHLLSSLFGLPIDGYSYLYVLSVNLSSWIFGALSLFLLYSSLKKFFSDRVSFWSSLGMYLATPWVYYQFLEPSMSHMASLLTVTVFLHFLIRINLKEKVNWGYLMIVIFAMVSVRWQNLLFLIAFLPALWSWRYNLKDLIGKIIAISIPVVVFWTSQLLLWKHLYGYYLLQPQGTGFVKSEFHGLYVLLSSDRGLLLWSPLIILALAGFYYLYKKNKFLFFISILVFLAQWAINGSLNDLGGGDAFGARRFIETLPFLAIALAAFWENVKNKKLIIIITTILIILNFILIANYHSGDIPHNGSFKILTKTTIRYII